AHHLARLDAAAAGGAPGAARWTVDTARPDRRAGSRGARRAIRRAATAAAAALAGVAALRCSSGGGAGVGARPPTQAVGRRFAPAFRMSESAGCREPGSGLRGRAIAGAYTRVPKILSPASPRPGRM